jgi:3-methylfumaryl-CoA hydratase
VCGTPSTDGKTVELWAKDHEGFLTMRATAAIGKLQNGSDSVLHTLRGI